MNKIHRNSRTFRIYWRFFCVSIHSTKEGNFLVNESHSNSTQEEERKKAEWKCCSFGSFFSAARFLCAVCHMAIGDEGKKVQRRSHLISRLFNSMDVEIWGAVRVLLLQNLESGVKKDWKFQKVRGKSVKIHEIWATLMEPRQPQKLFILRRHCEWKIRYKTRYTWLIYCSFILLLIRTAKRSAAQLYRK